MAFFSILSRATVLSYLQFERCVSSVTIASRTPTLCRCARTSSAEFGSSTPPMYISLLLSYVLIAVFKRQPLVTVCYTFVPSIACCTAWHGSTLVYSSHLRDAAISTCLAIILGNSVSSIPWLLHSTAVPTDVGRGSLETTGNRVFHMPKVNPIDMPRTPYWASEGKHSQQPTMPYTPPSRHHLYNMGSHCVPVGKCPRYSRTSIGRVKENISPHPHVIICSLHH